ALPSSVWQRSALRALTVGAGDDRTHAPELHVALVAQLRRGLSGQALEGRAEPGVEERRRAVEIGVRAPGRLRDDPVDDAALRQVPRRAAQRARGGLDVVLVLPQ